MSEEKKQEVTEKMPSMEEIKKFEMDVNKLLGEKDGYISRLKEDLKMSRVIIGLGVFFWLGVLTCKIMECF